MLRKIVGMILGGLVLAICAGCSACAQEPPDQQKVVAQPSETAAVKVEKQEETAAFAITDRPVSHTVKPDKIEETQGRTEPSAEAKASEETEIAPATKAPATTKIPTATKAPATKQPTAGKTPEKTPAKTKQPAATQKPTATKAPAETKAPATKAPAASPSPTKKGHYEKVWVVDRQAETVVEDVYEEVEIVICLTCGKDITKNETAHSKQHILNGENDATKIEWVKKKVGTKTTEIPEKGHWEKVWVED